MFISDMTQGEWYFGDNFDNFGACLVADYYERMFSHMQSIVDNMFPMSRY